MRKTSPIMALVAVALTTALFLPGCGINPPSAPAPGIQPQIVNNADDFSYQVSNVADYSGTATYSWQNSGVSANVNQATTVNSGNMTLVIQDAAGTQVYARSLADNGTFVTSAGIAGTWTIQITYGGASGTVNFRAQKKT